MTASLGVAGLLAALLGMRTGWSRNALVTPEEMALVKRLTELAQACGLARMGSGRGEGLGSAWRPSELVRTLFSGRTAGEVLALEDSELERLLSQAMEADFRTGQLVTVEGWFLTQTEAHLRELAVR
ncbi:MAG: hypothetical protein ACOY0T_35230 [Myxococcota bacterium]